MRRILSSDDCGGGSGTIIITVVVVLSFGFRTFQQHIYIRQYSQITIQLYNTAETGPQGVKDDNYPMAIKNINEYKKVHMHGI